MRKNVLQKQIDGMVLDVAKAHGIPVEQLDQARSLLGLTLRRNAAKLIAATNPPVPEAEVVSTAAVAAISEI